MGRGRWGRWLVAGAVAAALVLVPALAAGAGSNGGSRSGGDRGGAGSGKAGNGVERQRYRYGPIPVAPGQNSIEATLRGVPKPAVDGWIVGITPDLVDADDEIPPSELIHLHHAVWLKTDATDATWPELPERFFFSGEEKTRLRLPPGYGYPHRAADTWILNYMIMNRTADPWTVYITYEVDYIPAGTPAADGVEAVRPIWLDVANQSIYPVFDVARGSGERGRFTYPDDAGDPYAGAPPLNEWTVDADGTLVFATGHLHPGGLYDDLFLERAGEQTRLFRSKARYWDPNGPVSWDMAITVTKRKWRAGVRAGDVLRLTSTYDTEQASWYESMGLMIVWMADDPNGPDPFEKNVDRPGRLTHGHLPENDNHGGAGESKATVRDESGAVIATVDVVGFGYEPGNLGGALPTVAPGATLTFTNRDASGAPDIWHSITACAPPCDGETGIGYPIANGDVAFDSGLLGFGGPPTAETITWAPPADLAPGTYTYFCRIHPDMRGAFRVAGA